MTHGSLFSGIGGFDLASEWMGWENKFHCEWNEFGQKVLKYYWPDAESFSDITKTDFKKYANKIDILTGGFPCQPYSAAGKRLGKADDRHLWPEMLRAITEIRPSWIVGENVFGLINWSEGMVFEEVQTDLEAIGYEVFAYVLPAASVNAPHRRDRIWFVAYAGCNGQQSGEFGENRCAEDESQSIEEQRKRIWANFGRTGEPKNASNATSKGLQKSKEDKLKKPLHYAKRNNTQIHSDAEDIGLQGRCDIREIKGKRSDGNKLFNGLRECQGWENFPTQSPVCTGNDGIPTGLDGITFPKWRNESIKAAGNAIVPQVALQIFKAIEQYENITI